MPSDVEYVRCLNCDTPCYTFELDAKGRVVSAFCATCANDDPSEFSTTDESDEEDRE